MVFGSPCSPHVDRVIPRRARMCIFAVPPTCIPKRTFHKVSTRDSTHLNCAVGSGSCSFALLHQFKETNDRTLHLFVFLFCSILLL